MNSFTVLAVYMSGCVQSSPMKEHLAIELFNYHCREKALYAALVEDCENLVNEWNPPE